MTPAASIPNAVHVVKISLVTSPGVGLAVQPPSSCVGSPGMRSSLLGTTQAHGTLWNPNATAIH